MQQALKELLATADKALSNGPYSVVYKSKTPPSGDKHDYMSVGPYFWPDPSKPDGLPYIRKDGRVNPEREKYDRPLLGKMLVAGSTLGRAYSLTGEEKDAQKASRLLRVWFLDAETPMNANLNLG